MDSMIGQKFGRLTVLELRPKPRPDRKNGQHQYYLCRCDCGVEKEILKQRLLTGRTKSCGCLKSELAKQPHHVKKYDHFVPGETKVNYLTFIRDTENPGYATTAKFVIVRCDCGKEITIKKSHFYRGEYNSCGCQRKNARILEAGMKFGCWTLISETFTQYTRHKQLAWICKCECGTEKKVDKYSLLSGHSTNCGCKRSEALIERNYKHGLSDHYLYHDYTRIMRRCYNPDDVQYPDYGGRGIDVSERLRETRALFVERVLAAIGERPTPKHSIDRIDNTKGYSEDNIRWATREQQQRNTRHSKIVEFEGQRYTIDQLADKLGLNYYLLYHQIIALCKSAEDAVKFLQDQK